MNQENALKVLISAVEIGQKAGAYSLKDAAVIAQAVAVFTTKTKPENEKAVPAATQPKVEKPLPIKKK
jgi:hypothetical protein